MNSLARVLLWGQEIGVISWDDSRGIGIFEFTETYQRSVWDIAPFMMPKNQGSVFSFPGHRGSETFLGLPGLLSDSLPDKYGNAVIANWMSRHGRTALNPVERLCYTGSRGMGALTYQPTIKDVDSHIEKMNVNALSELAQSILLQTNHMSKHLGPSGEDDDGLKDIFLVGTSAGGARAKAVLAWNRHTGEVISGQSKAPDGFCHYLFKFDVSGNRDKELTDPQGFCRIEFAYYNMAIASGIDMSESELYEENGRAHFITQRFDRVNVDLGDRFDTYTAENDPRRLHMQSLCALKHMDYNLAGAHGYEQIAQIIRQLVVEPEQQQLDLEQQYRRMLFNIMARNQDDHAKNVAFLMDRHGQWRLSPAFDVTYSYNPTGQWTNAHQMTINGKRDNFTLDDLTTTARKFNVKNPHEMIEAINVGLDYWPDIADMAGVHPAQKTAIMQNFRRVFK